MIHVADFWDVLGGLLLLALWATVLTKANTSKVITAGGNAFTGALKVAEAG